MVFYRHAVLAVIFILTLLCAKAHAYTVAEIFQPGGMEEVYQAALPVAQNMKNIDEFDGAFKDFLMRIENLLGQRTAGWQAGILENFRGWICYATLFVKMELAKNPSSDAKARLKATESLRSILTEALTPLFEQLREAGVFRGDSQHFQSAFRAFLNSHS